MMYIYAFIDMRWTFFDMHVFIFFLMDGCMKCMFTDDIMYAMEQ